MTGQRKEQRLQAAVYCCAGKRRNNEDAFFLNGRWKEPEEMDKPILWFQNAQNVRALYAVCDGMGGLESGEKAALLAVSALRDCLEDLYHSENVQEAMLSAFQVMGKQIRRASNKSHLTMGAVAVLALIRSGELTVCNLGDSRAYLYLNGGLRQLSRDHTVAQTLIDMGFPATGQNRLLQYLGMDHDEFEPEPHLSTAAFPQGAKLLLCSDGLGLRPERLKKILEQPLPPASLVKQMIQESESSDNMTALVVERI